ncbi:MAG: hypothetical protein ABFE08_09550 [Armatimonadia bacterium]
MEALKQHLLEQELMSDSRFDATIAAIGSAVGGLLDELCNRRLAYDAAAVEQRPADRDFLALPHYPVVAVSKVELKYEGGLEWAVLENEPVMLNEQSGLIHFSGVLGGRRDLVRVSYSGGYWFETLDPNEDGYPSAKPAGATELPGALRGAFLVQCEQVWQTHDRLGTGNVGADAAGQFLNTKLSTLELVPLVKSTVQRFVRYG